jgi:hypothetical protein
MSYKSKDSAVDSLKGVVGSNLKKSVDSNASARQETEPTILVVDSSKKHYITRY